MIEAEGGLRQNSLSVLLEGLVRSKVNTTSKWHESGARVFET